MNLTAISVEGATDGQRALLGALSDEFRSRAILLLSIASQNARVKPTGMNLKVGELDSVRPSSDFSLVRKEPAVAGQERDEEVALVDAVGEGLERLNSAVREPWAGMRREERRGKTGGERLEANSRRCPGTRTEGVSG